MTITTGDAIAIASQWINETDLPIRSAFIGGSIAYAEPTNAYDPASDVDCYLVIDGDPPEGKIGKITVNGVLLDVSWLPWSQLEAAESHAVFASLLHFGRIVRDEDGDLSRLQAGVNSRFATADAVATRLADMRQRIRNGLGSDSSHLAEPEQVMNWLFPATLATHIPLIAACAPLTVRKRFIAAKKVMAEADYESLLALYGFDGISGEQAQGWLDDTAKLFDSAAPLAETSSRFWAGDIKSDARPIAIGGSQQLIDTGLHRDALYWIIASQTRCLTVMNDRDVDTVDFLPAFREMTTTLAIATGAQRSARSENILKWIDQYDHHS